MTAVAMAVAAAAAMDSGAIAFRAADPIFTAESSRPIGPRPVIESPCNRLCTLDPASGRCLGCGRSLDEITRWTQMTDAERARVVADLARRSVTRRRPVV
jgi:predicted Fe-S protein YdhL (DUF1289 family)